MTTFEKHYCTLKAALLEKTQFSKRFEINRNYMLSMKSENLLQNFYLEAGMKYWSNKPSDDIHWGWESPECQLRGHFPGHWLSAAARIFAQTGDEELKGKADYIVSQIEICQKENGGQWAGTIPEKYLDFIARGKHVWAPQYTIHKTFMGLVDMAKFAGSKKALDIADKWADWFVKWTQGFSREQMDNILDFETGAMLEVWADLYGLTGADKYLTLMERYDRPRLFNSLLSGEDPLTNKHANTTIPEIHGAARAYEVTGNERYRRIVENYWQQAVTERGYFVTGGQSTGEVWTAKKQQGARLGPTDQEHCVVYNMIRLADFLFRWTGDVQYSDYIERNIYNGIFAQQHIRTGMVAYYLPLHGGSKINWGTPTNSFWCCHGTLVQAHTLYADLAFYRKEKGLVISQYIPSKVNFEHDGIGVEVTQKMQYDRNSVSAPDDDCITIEIKASQPAEFDLQVRIPWWAGKTSLSINGKEYEGELIPSSFVTLKQKWDNDSVVVRFTRKLTLCPADDMPQLAAIMYGPVVLAALSENEIQLYTSNKPVEKLLRRFDDDYLYDAAFYTLGQPVNVKLVPLYDVLDQKYSVYFQLGCVDNV